MSDYVLMQVNKMISIDKCLAIFNVKPTATPISAVIHFEFSSDDGLTWDSLLVRPINSGIPQEYIMIPGIFYADIQHATHIKYVRDLAHDNFFTVKVKFVSNLTLQNETTRSTKRYTPVPARLSPIIRSTIGREISDVTPDGTIYAYGGLNLYKSTDLGISWIPIQSPFTQGNISRFKKLSSRELLIIGNNLDGKKGLQVWKSDPNEKSIHKVAVLDTVSDANSFWGLESYDNIILFAPYVLQPRKSNQILKAYISRDYGQSWQSIFQAPVIDSWHFHNIKLDPYESRIWLLSGDGSKKTNVWFTDDWGQNWSSLWPEGESPVQFTDLAILPHCLIFGMDDNKGRGFFRLDKTTNRLSAGALNSQMHEAFFIDKIGTPADATGTFITHQNVAYLPTESPRGLLTATMDGINYYVLWDYTQQPTGPVEGLSYFSATITGKLIGYFKDDSSKSSPFIWVADQPKWIEI
ncbi:WD40/YVTN/BNR-like repeat-containing protein [Paenisporosarcina indica]|uniref:WD40/YVTN/BNR-like repeat-containing protein n=1 Tax=Paenisporosarcina indica TaxID=650093 RepID=UPI00094FDAE0|nr:hypothetical protein [Paenisporosarcina indica]